MAETRRFGLTPQLDIENILLEAQHRWLRPAEICEILRNYKNFRISPEPPNRPRSGAVFLFDRKVLRYFRKDGHNWRKKKDGKTVKEAHERLKAGSIDVLHCYYAHGEEDGNFQRRSYWMLEEDFMHIVLVHYREVKSKESYGRTREIEAGITQHMHYDSPAASNSLGTYKQRTSQAASMESPNSLHMSEYEDAEPDNCQASSRYNPLLELCEFSDKPVMDATNLVNHYFPDHSQNIQGIYREQTTGAPEASFFSLEKEDVTKYFDGVDAELTFSGSRTQINSLSWEEVLKDCKAGLQETCFPSPLSSFNCDVEEITNRQNVLEEQNAASQSNEVLQQFVEQEVDPSLASNLNIRRTPSKGMSKYSSLLKQLSLDLPDMEGEKGLQKHDSFSRWMSNELEEVDGYEMSSSSQTYWDAVERENVVSDCISPDQQQLDSYILSPSVSPDQLFSISDFSPNWTYSDSETKIIVTGTFLKNKNFVEKCKWSCMFGEVEVPAEVLCEGILQCHAPPRKSGRVPFYVTCSNRLACSEVREFEYRDSNDPHLEKMEPYDARMDEMLLFLRLEKFLFEEGCPSESGPRTSICIEKANVCNKISSLLMGTDDSGSSAASNQTNEEFSHYAKDHVLKTMLKGKLQRWLIDKVIEEDKSPNVLDKEGAGVIHLAAALDYDWAIAPIIAAGVNINFRDTHGWTALHWAACYGRETTVVALLSLGAASGALTDPTPEFPSGRTPADLASGNHHKGIAGFLAEDSLNSHLSTLTLKQSGESDVSGVSVIKSAENDEEKKVIQVTGGDVQAHLSLKDSLMAVRNAAQTAARIHQVFRVQSFHRKERIEFGDTNQGMSNERAMSLISVKANRAGPYNEPIHAAAIRIQNKFRGWKGRKDFLIIRQRIVKIQAHVRGHQVRKHFRKIVWSVGIVEKVILRWRRKGCGLRGFRSEGITQGPAMQIEPSRADDYDFLQEGRKQTEARLERALARVKSMVQYPEARDQYRRLLTGVEEFQESKVVLERIMNDPEEPADSAMISELEEFLGDDTFMPTS